MARAADHVRQIPCQIFGHRRIYADSRRHRHAAQAGLDPAEFSGHSLREGFVTSTAKTGASILKIRIIYRKFATT